MEHPLPPPYVVPAQGKLILGSSALLQSNRRRKGTSRGVTMLVLKASVSHRDQEEQQGLGGFGSTALAAPSAWQVPGVGPAFGGQTLSWAYPCGHAGSYPSPGHLSAAVPTCPVICMTNSNLFYRKPSHWGCQGKVWLVWAVCVPPLCCHGEVSP